ncbi:hypothetical protein B0O80DRAFT_448607 [Mortierella sp. GBAus27b]|nr:hypothetical protein B0O80DRAFT_448607 [Mortierella sp. GBAus27b]
MGSSKTKARNGRRQLAKRYNAQAQDPQAGAKNTSGENQSASTQKRAAASQPTPPPSSVAAPASKIIMTTVNLDDSAQMRKSRNKPFPRKAAQSNWKSSPKNHVNEDNNTRQLDEETVNSTHDTSDKSKDPDLTSEETSLPPNYEELTKLDGYPGNGDVIAYKLLELDSSYTPTVSDFKEATVMSFSETDMEAQVLLAPRFRKPIELDDSGNPILGKFEIYDEDAIERAKQGIVIISWKDLVECRIVAKK